MMTEFKRTQRDYPLSFKIAVVEQVEKGEMTYKQAQQRYGIQGRSEPPRESWRLNFLRKR
ncbi:putative iSPsy11, transposase OrfA [Escherichia coli 2-316-03_S4_C2]|nr:putative iSPsy11, transposase OrfA [Escherichia coli 2-316-03_S4_C2]